jgi:hypothetical protein
MERKEHIVMSSLRANGKERKSLLVLSSVNHLQIMQEYEGLRKYYKVKYIETSFHKNFVKIKPEKKFWTLLRNIPSTALFIVKYRILPPLSPLSFPLFLLYAPLILSLYEKQVKIDLIYAHWLYPAGFVGSILKKLINRKLVTAIWGFDIDASISKGLTNTLLRHLSKCIIMQSDLIITNHIIHKNIAKLLAGNQHASKIINLG